MSIMLRNHFKRLLEKIVYLGRDGFFHILIGNVLIKIVAFVSSVVVVRIVTKSEFGLLSYSDTLYNYITLLSGLGLSTALLKFCSSEKEVGINAYYFDISVKYGCLFQLLLSVVLVIYSLLANIEFPEARPLIVLLVFFPVGTQLVTTLQSFARSQMNNKLYARMGVIQTIILFLSSLLFTLLLGVKGVILARYVAIGVVVIIGYNYVRKIIPRETVIKKITSEEKKQFWKISISLMLANLFSMIMPVNESYMISKMIGSEIVLANYKIATLIPSQIMFITSSVIVYSFPKVAHLYEKKKNAFRYTVKTNLILVGIVAAILIVGIISSDLIIRLIYGTEYSDAGDLSRIYWISYSINAAFRMLPMSLLPAFGITTANFVFSIVFCILHIVFLYFLIPQYGIFGSAYTSIIVYILSGVAYWILLYVWNKKQTRS